MNFIVYDSISKYWLEIVLMISLLASLILFILWIVNKFFKKPKSFNENYSKTKQINLNICIDLEERTAETYYLFDQNHKGEIMSLDEFLCRFDKQNLEKLKAWLAHIAKMTDFNKTRRHELIMYNSKNEKRIYIVELERYDAEAKRYYLNFKDMTDSANIFRRASKINLYSENEEFIKKANEKLYSSDDASENILVAFKCKEHAYALKELQYDVLRLVEDSVYKKINSLKSENDILYLTDSGTFLLFSSNIVNIKKYKKNIKKLIVNCSGEYEIILNKFSYTVNLVAGYTKVSKNEKINSDKIYEAETAADSLINKNRLAERLQLFDENFKTIHTINDNKILAVEAAIKKNLITLNYEPIIKTSSKSVVGYNVQIIIPQSLNMSLEEFINFAKLRSYRLTFFTKIFEMIRKHPDCLSKNFYISIDFNNLGRAMEAFQLNDAFKAMKIYFCLEFSNTTMQNTDLITIEKTLATQKEIYHVKFGITYNSLTTLYLNAKIYSKLDVCLLAGDLIDQSLDEYSNSSLLEVYTNIASKYNQDVIGLNVNSLAIYELLSHYNVNKLSGSFLTPYVVNGSITDKSILKTLKEIENRNY